MNPLLHRFASRFRFARQWGPVIRAFVPIADGRSKRTPDPSRNMQQIVMVVVSQLRIDPRVERGARKLAADGFEVVIVAPDVSHPPHSVDPLDWGPNITFDLQPATAGNYIMGAPYIYGAEMLTAARKYRPFAFHGHDLNSALVALRAAHDAGAQCVVDYHEWHSENVRWNVKADRWTPYPFFEKTVFRLAEWIATRRADSVITVCGSIADQMAKAASVPRSKIKLVRNVPRLDAEPSKEYPDLHKQIGVEPSRFLVLYQGGTGKTRLLEPVIRALAYAPNVTLVIRGPSLDWFGDHYRKIAEMAGAADRLILIGPVPSADVVAAARGAHVGIWTLPKLSKNFYFALPNKIFEYLAAGLPVLVADYPEARGIANMGVGLTFDPNDPKSIGAQMQKLYEDRELLAKLRDRVPGALHDLDVEDEWAKLVDIYRGMRQAEYATLGIEPGKALLPFDFSDGAVNWTVGMPAIGATVNPGFTGSIQGTPGIGKVGQFRHLTTIMSMGSIALTPPRAYQLSAKLRCVQPSTDDQSPHYFLGVRAWDAAGEFLGETFPGGAVKAYNVEDGWIEVSTVFNPASLTQRDAAFAAAAHIRPVIYLNHSGSDANGYSTNATTQLAELRVEDATGRAPDPIPAGPAPSSQPGDAPRGDGIRVLHAPNNVGNQPWTLSRAERRLGAASDLVINYNTWLNLPADRVLSAWATTDMNEVRERAAFGMTAPFDYDVMHYYFGRSLMQWEDLGPLNTAPFADLRLAKALGKKVFMTLQGCDARLGAESNARNAHTMCRTDGCGSFQTCIDTIDNSRKSMIDTILPLCDRVFALNPELCHYAPNAVFLPYANLDVEAFKPIPPRSGGRPLILHAPSDPKIKGTALIEAALETLSAEFDFDYRQVSGLPHAEAMKLYGDADLVIDQVLAGWYGGFSVELMAMGKPVACYLREEDLGFVPKAMLDDLPILQIRPDHLVEDLRSALSRRDEWADIAKRSRDFVLRWHNPRLIAELMLEAYADPASNLRLSRLGER